MKNLNRFERIKNWKSALVVVPAIFVIGTISIFAKDFVTASDLNVEYVQKILANQDTKFPIDVNEKVVDQLNRLVRTDEGKKYVKDALARYENYKEILDKNFQKYNAPTELLAVALIESGFENPNQSPKLQRSAGMWQFIPTTARNYNLKVNPQVDERLNVNLATDAALRYLHGMFYKFQDWRLALMAYNAGELQVQRGIEKTGSRDPWKIIDSGFENDKNYLAKIMAGAIILKNPNI